MMLPQRTLAILAILSLHFGVKAQTPSPAPQAKVRIHGRVVSADGDPAIGFSVNLARLGTQGWENKDRSEIKAEGTFSFLVSAGESYRIALDSGFTAPPKVLNAVSGTDIDLGEIVLEHCPDPVYDDAYRSGLAPRVSGNLPDGRIILASKPSVPSADGQLWLHSRSTANQSTEAASRKALARTAERPPCWYKPSLDRRSEWAGLCKMDFFQWVSLQDFVGGLVKSIHVVDYSARMKPEQVRDEIRKVWLGSFHDTMCSIFWDEITPWDLRAEVEFYDGRRIHLLTDGMHVEVEDLEGRYWYLREWPAID